jgi:hypothetical protein
MENKGNNVAGDKQLIVNDKTVTLKDLGRTEGGRHRLKAQFYVSGIGQIFLTAYAVEKEIDAPPARRGRPPGSPNKGTKAMADMIANLTAKVEALTKGNAPAEAAPVQTPEQAQIAALEAKIAELSKAKA